MTETHSAFKVIDDFGDEVASSDAAPPLGLGSTRLTPGTFRADAAKAAAGLGGTAANGEAFTTARVVDDDARFVNDVWMRSGPRLLQLRVSYAKHPTGWSFEHADVARYAQTGSNLDNDDALDDLGTGIYDVHRRLRDMAAEGALDMTTGIHELRLGGRVTAAFPRKLSVPLAPLESPSINGNGGGVVSLDWSAPTSNMRVQVDRVFDAPDGAMTSFEITDILKEDAEKYPAAFNPDS